jgi:N-acetylmuramoyl-L-alanine amidase
MNLTTISQIKSFQKKYGLVPDGIVGPQTRRVISELERPVSASARVEPNKSAINVRLPNVPAPVSQRADADPKTITLASTARPISEIIVHCTATPEGRYYDRRDVNAWHKQRGFEMIGYHYLILLDGTIQVGRPIGMIGAHCENHNTGTIGVSYVGGLTKDVKSAKDTRTPQQRASLKWLVRSLKTKYSIHKRAKGHNEYAQKACPSFRVQNDALGAI